MAADTREAEDDALLDRARRALDRERRRTADERDAFDDLHRRVREIPPATAPATGGSEGATGGAVGARAATRTLTGVAVTVCGRPVVAFVEPADVAADDTTWDVPEMSRVAAFDALADTRSALLAVREDCDAVAADRQAAVHEQAHRLSVSIETADVQRYCYGWLRVAYPVLSAATDVSDRVETCRRAVERAMATCG